MKKSAVCLLCLLSVLVAVGCSERPPEQQKAAKIELNIERQIMVPKEKLALIPKTSDNQSKVVWESDDEAVATVTQDGVVTALKTGICKVSARISKDEYDFCDIAVGDSLVSAGFDASKPGFGEVYFSSIQKACDKGGTIYILNGKFDEFVTAMLPVRLIGEGKVKFRGISGKEVVLEKLSIVSNLPPQGNEALVAAESLTMQECDVAVNDDSLTGGYGVFVGKNATKFFMSECTFSNFRYAVYVYRAAAELKVNVNKFGNCAFGIGVNLRSEGQMFSDFAASGQIKANIFLNCQTNTEFLYNGSAYRGELDFFDHKNKVESEQEKK